MDAAAAMVEYKEGRARPLPKDYCWRNMDSGDPCNNKIRPENARAQLWACGRHMAKYQEEQQRKIYHEEHKAREEALTQIAELELVEYERTWNRLVDLGWQEYLPEKPYRKSWGRRVENTKLEMDLKVFLSLVDPEEEEQEEDEPDDKDYATVEEDFFKSASDV